MRVWLMCICVVLVTHCAMLLESICVVVFVCVCVRVCVCCACVI